MTILITGASKGIGFETVKYLCNHHRVIAISRSPISYNHPNIIPIQGDIRSEQTLLKCTEYFDKNNLSLNILINNASYLIHKPFEEISEEDLITVYETNVFAVFRWTQRMLTYLKKSDSAHIINISSMGGITGTQKFAELSAYSSSKGAVSVLTECLAEELKPYRISCNALALGSVQTEMFSNAFPQFKASFSPIQIAEFIGWFVLNGHRFFNGKILPIAITTP